MPIQHDDSFMQEFRAILECVQAFAQATYPAIDPFRVELVRSSSVSDVSGYFIFLAGGNNPEEQHFEKRNITAMAGIFAPGIYLTYDHVGGPILLPTKRIEIPFLEKAWFRHRRKQEEELAFIKEDCERFLATR